jgi:large subunit ribosomal protein L3
VVYVKGIVGRKIGMTQVFDPEDGHVERVTVIEAGPCFVTGIRRSERDGYDAVQLAFGETSEKLLNRPKRGLLKKAGVGNLRHLREFRGEPGSFGGDDSELQVGAEVRVDSVFEPGQRVKVSGISKGKGFAGTIKRHHFRSGDASHGNSLSHRTPGSTGQRQTPGRVFKGKRMAGHLGNVQRTIQNLDIVRVDPERNLLFIKGAVPGSKGGDVIVRPAVRRIGKIYGS